MSVVPLWHCWLLKRRDLSWYLSISPRCCDAAEGSQQRLHHATGFQLQELVKLLVFRYPVWVFSCSNSLLVITPPITVSHLVWLQYGIQSFTSFALGIWLLIPDTQEWVCCSYLSSFLCVSLILLNIQNAQQGFKHIKKCQYKVKHGQDGTRVSIFSLFLWCQFGAVELYLKRGMGLLLTTLFLPVFLSSDKSLMPPDRWYDAQRISVHFCFFMNVTVRKAKFSIFASRWELSSLLCLRTDSFHPPCF